MGKCATPIKGKGADFTILDCGAPVTAADSVLRLWRFVSCRISYVYTDAVSFQLNDAEGNPIVDLPGCSTLSYADVEFEMDGITPEHTAWLTGDRLAADDEGAVFGKRTECAPFFGVRIWQEFGAGRLVCAGGSTEYLIHHLAAVTDFKVTGSYEIGAGVTRTTMTGRAFPNEGTYGTGPHADWTTAWQDEEIHGYMRSTLAPPTEAADCSLVAFPIV